MATRYVKGRNGRFKGSVGVSRLPTAARRVPKGEPGPQTEPGAAACGTDVTYDRFLAAAGDAATPGMDVSRLTAKYADRRARVDAIMCELEAGVTQMATSDGYQRFLDGLTKFHSYSWRNVLLIAAQKPDATQVAGYGKWQEMGRQVRKGERGIVILMPTTARINLKDERGLPVVDADGKPKTVNRCTGFRAGTVFDVSQTDGDPLPEPPAKPLAGHAPEGFQAALEGAIRARGYTVEHGDAGGANGFTDPVGKRVIIQEGMSAAQTAKTTAHEYGHVLAHSELAAYRGCRGRAEVEAESVAYVLCKSRGMDSGGYTFGYVATWAAAKTSGAASPTDAVKQTANTVRATVAEALAGLEAAAAG